MDALGVVGAVAVFAEDGEIEAGVVGLEADALLGGVPGQEVDPVAEADGLAFGLLHPHGELLVLGPVPQESLDPFGHRLVVALTRGAGGLFGAGDDDGLLAAEDVGEDGLDEHARVAVLAAVGGAGVAGEVGELGGLVADVGGEACRPRGGVRHRREPRWRRLREGPAVGHAKGVAVDGLVVRPSPGVDDDVLDAAEQAHGAHPCRVRPRAL